jgi:nucleoside-diphosphate-sugar epimerase
MTSAVGTTDIRVLCTGAGGFVGTHLVRHLKELGFWVRGVDLKKPLWSDSPADEYRFLDLRFPINAAQAVQDIDWVFHLAADMGGMGTITSKTYEIIRNNTLINAHTIDAARAARVDRFLFSSSACVYPAYRQDGTENKPLAEEDAYPADPQESYGWEKLHMEHLCREYRGAGLNTKIVRFHNCYGPEGTFQGGREKAPAALSRKVAVAKLFGYPRIQVWGDGLAVRSYMHVADCVEGLLRLMQSDHPGPLNLGRDRTVTVNELVDLIASAAGVQMDKVYVEGPQGVRWRNSDNSLCREVLEWEPSIPLEEGIIDTYEWIEGQVGKIFSEGGTL